MTGRYVRGGWHGDRPNLAARRSHLRKPYAWLLQRSPPWRTGRMG